MEKIYYLKKIIAVGFSQRNISDEFTGFSLKHRHSPVVDFWLKQKKLFRYLVLLAEANGHDESLYIFRQLLNTIMNMGQS